MDDPILEENKKILLGLKNAGLNGSRALERAGYTLRSRYPPDRQSVVDRHWQLLS